MRVASIAAILVAGLSLSGCLAYEVASTTVGAVGTVVGTTVDVASGAVCTIACSSDKEDK